MICACSDCCSQREHWKSAEEAGNEAHRRWVESRALSSVVSCSRCALWVVKAIQR